MKATQPIKSNSVTKGGIKNILFNGPRRIIVYQCKEHNHEDVENLKYKPSTGTGITNKSPPNRLLPNEIVDI